MKNLTLTPVLLPTEEASPIGFYNGLMYELEKVEYKNDDVKSQHLYLCSTLPIKEGEEGYIYHPDGYIKKVTGYEFQSDKRDGCKKIEFTTDPKLIADGVPAIDGNTKVLVDDTQGGYFKVNFLTEFCKRYNQKDKSEKCQRCGLSVNEHQEPDYLCYNRKSFYQKDNQKGVDVEKLADEQLGSGYTNYELVRASWIAGFKYSQSLTKEQPKGDIVIECEMEQFNPAFNEGEDVDYDGMTAYYKIKFNKDGQPILTFK